MSFSDLQGNENLIARLKRMICSGRIFHGCLFEGNAKETEALAFSFVKAVLCERQDGDACGICTACRKFEAQNSEDVSVIGGDGTVRDKDIEMLIQTAMKKSYTGHPLFLIVRNAERMTLRAQNRLLKTLEEPPSGVRILLLAENAELLTPTIRSRCIFFRLESALQKEHFVSREEKEQALDFICGILEGKPFYALSQHIARFSSSAEDAARFFGTAEMFFRDVLVSFYDRDGSLVNEREEMQRIRRCADRFTPRQMAEAAVCTENAQKDLAFHVSPGRALKYMIFDIQEKLKG